MHLKLLPLLPLLFLSSSVLGAGQPTVVFVDGFELGTTCGWQGGNFRIRENPTSELGATVDLGPCGQYELFAEKSPSGFVDTVSTLVAKGATISDELQLNFDEFGNPLEIGRRETKLRFVWDNESLVAVEVVPPGLEPHIVVPLGFANLVATRRPRGESHPAGGNLLLIHKSPPRVARHVIWVARREALRWAWSGHSGNEKVTHKNVEDSTQSHNVREKIETNRDKENCHRGHRGLREKERHEEGKSLGERPP